MFVMPRAFGNALVTEQSHSILILGCHFLKEIIQMNIYSPFRTENEKLDPCPYLRNFDYVCKQKTDHHMIHHHTLLKRELSNEYLVILHRLITFVVVYTN